jgi:hypothetical protein
MIPALIWFLVLILVAGLIWWVITQIVPLPPPFLQVAQVVLVLILLIALISLLMPLLHMPPMLR